MASVYILYSETIDKFYIGSTRDKSEIRLKKHNSKHKGFTSSVDDWKIVYEEYFEEYKDARKREIQIKNWKSRKSIEEMIKRNSQASEHPGL